MFERYTDRARRVVVLAQDEARMLKHDHIGPAHLFLGLLRAEDGIASRALTGMGITLETARAHVQETQGVGAWSHTGHIPFSPACKEVLEVTLREALQLGHNYVGTEHLLLGLVRLDRVPNLGDPQAMRIRVLDLLSDFVRADGRAPRSIDDVLRDMDRVILRLAHETARLVDEAKSLVAASDTEDEQSA